MKKTIGELWRLAFITVIGLAGSMVAGLMTYGSDIFTPESPGFAYFIMYGVCTSFIFAFYHVRGLSNTITAALGTGIVIFFIIARFGMPMLNSAIWSFGVSLLVVVIAFLFERKLSNVRQVKFIFVGFFYGSLFVLLTLLVGIMTQVTAFPPKVFQNNFLDGLYLGIGVGVGVEIAEALIHSMDLHGQVSNKKPVRKRKK
jgi:hypothetical protein